MKNIVLLGFMGTGKTAIGRRLAQKFGMEFVDIDDLIQKDQKKSIAKIFEENGEPYFRDVEKRVIKEVSEKQGLVIGAGGGAVLFDENIKNLEKNGVLICLTATPDVILKRTKGLKHRPLLNVEDPKQRIEELLQKRAPYYAKIKNQIDTSNLTQDQVVEEISQLYKK